MDIDTDVKIEYDLERYKYYDPTEFGDDLMPQSETHDVVARYICLILDWLFHESGLTSRTSLEFHFPDENMPPISPDVALLELSAIENMPGDRTVYYVGTTGPAPRIVFEVASKKTWPTDLEHKPDGYAQLGVQEYFSIDPTIRGVWKRSWKNKNRLVGWRTEANGQPVEIAKDERGWLWSEQLQSWLAVENREVRFYDADGNLRLTGEEAADRRAVAAELVAEVERQLAEEARQRAEAERLEKEAAQQQIELQRLQTEAAQQQAEAERLQNEKMAAKLRELGIDPNTLT